MTSLRILVVKSEPFLGFYPVVKVNLSILMRARQMLIITAKEAIESTTLSFSSTLERSGCLIISDIVKMFSFFVLMPLSSRIMGTYSALPFSFFFGWL